MEQASDALRADAEAAITALKELDETTGTTLLLFGKFHHQTYAKVAAENPSYCHWARSQIFPSGGLADFKMYADRRWELETPLRQMRDIDRLNMQRVEREKELKRKAEAEEERRRQVKARKELLDERMRTSRGEQLIGLAALTDLFDIVLGHLPLFELLNLPRVCNALRNSTSYSRGDQWMRIVAVAMAKERSRVQQVEKGYDKKVKLLRHDEAVERFFHIPVAWNVGAITFSGGELHGFDQHLQLKKLMASQCDYYLKTRNEVRLAIQDLKTKRRQFNDQVEKMVDLDKPFKKLVASNARAKNAINAASGFFALHKIKPTTLPADASNPDLPNWEKFAVDVRFVL